MQNFTETANSMEVSSTKSPCDEDCEYKIPGENWINGVRYIPKLTADVMSRMPEFPVHEDDVYICGYPKSGNIWTTQIVSAILHQDDLDSWKENAPIAVTRFMDVSFDKCVQIPRPSFFYNHMPYHMLPRGVREENAKIVHISRDPKDVAVSFYYFHRNVRFFGPWKGPWDVFYNTFISGEIAYGSYFTFVRTYWEQKSNPNVFNLRYENLKRDPKTWIGKLAEFLGKPLDHEKLEKIVELTSFSNMKKTPTLNPGGPFLRKGVVGDWRHLFSEEQRRQTDAVYHQLCKDMGMEFFKDE